MNYNHYELDDFLEDPYFREWVYQSSPEHDYFWQQYLLNNPDKGEIAINAKNILLQLSNDAENHFPDHDQVTAMWAKIQVGYDRSITPVKSLWPRIFMLTAAAAMIILVTGWLIKPAQKFKTNYESLVSSSKTELIQQKNLTDKQITLKLPDSSQIILQPRSTVSYPKNFSSGKEREVFLSGEAFFNVQRNPDRPFYVYANGLVTKVLGTSFIIKAFEDDHQVEVVVKTGKVSVFTCQEHMNSDDLKNITIVTPNQKVLYSRNAESIRKYLVDAPEVIVSATVPPPIEDFQDAPVSKIFTNLEESYGIEIVYDEKLLSECLLTASFSQESLYDKIDLICKGIEAEFEVVDTRIIVSGKGCH